MLQTFDMVKKALFLTLQPLKENDGISRKILNEFYSLRNAGFNIDLGYIKKIKGRNYFQINDIPIEHYGKSQYLWKILCRIKWKKIAKYIVTHNYKFIYVRYTHFASPWTVKLFKYLESKGITIFLEIPTYPYDQEYVNRKGILDNIAIRMEKHYRFILAKSLSRIVTFSDDNEIWGCPTVKIANGVNINDIPPRHRIESDNDCFNMIAVAAFSEWHGYDRILDGISNYIHSNGKVPIHFYLIGPDNPTCEKLKCKVEELGITNHVSFTGSMSGKELDEKFEIADIAIGSLGRHRSGIDKIRTLKNREYAARAIPFVYSEKDPDFDDKPYVLKVPANESPIDIKSLIDFCDFSNYELNAAREFVIKNLTWDSQMDMIKNSINKIEKDK